MRDRRKVLLIATTPFLNDGLTKIEMDVLKCFGDEMDFTVASRFGYGNEIGTALLNDSRLHCVTLPSKKSLFRYQREIRDLVEEGDYDVVYIHGNSPMMYFEANPARKAGAKLVVTHCHNSKSDFPRLSRFLKKRFNRSVDVKIAVSQLVADYAYDGRSVVTILNGPDISTFSYDEKKREDIRKELGWEKQFVVGHVGRFTEQKNHRKLIEVFEALHRLREDARLLLIGEGELEAEIRDLVYEKNLKECVNFFGVTKQVADYYNAMDVMVMPSLHEGLCLVAMEAQANGLPLLIADTFAEETLATASAYSIALDAPAEEWAREITEKMNLKRHDNAAQLKEKGLDWTVMMQTIGTILEGKSEFARR